MIVDDSNLEGLLFERFGHQSFRPPQREVILAVLEGRSALFVHPTGGGKSLSFQLPATILDGLTLVVSPLVALMEDQVQALRARGLRARCVHAQMDKDERQEALRMATASELDLLYLTPERFRVPGALETLQRAKIALFVLDEAHCLSHFGQDFRPDYARLGSVIKALGSPPFLALTATATPKVQDQILESLGEPDALRFVQAFDRRDLHLSRTVAYDRKQKRERLGELLRAVPGPGIIYCALIRELRELERELKADGFRVRTYHGELDAAARRMEQRRFLETEDEILLATSAFGLGVDKPNVRFVVHWQIPRHIEAYVQEIGRAGRDGLGAIAELLYCEEDLAIQRDFVDWANPKPSLLSRLVQELEAAAERGEQMLPEDLAKRLGLRNRDGRVDTCLAWAITEGFVQRADTGEVRLITVPRPAQIESFMPAEKHRSDLEALLGMVEYATHVGCAREPLAQWFEEDPPESCAACDHCLPREDFLAAETGSARKERQNFPIADNAAPLPTWIWIQGFGQAEVVRQTVGRRGPRIDVERITDGIRQSFDLAHIRWRRISDER